MTSLDAIDLPFTPQSVIEVLKWGAQPSDSPYSHKQIADWCESFCCEYIELEAPSEIEPLLPLLAAVENQWDLYLANDDAIQHFRNGTFEQVTLPAECFIEWLKLIKLE